MLRYENSKDESLSHCMPHSGSLPSLPPDVGGCPHPALEQMSFSSLVHHPVSNELPGSVNVAGRPCKAFHHRTAWQGHCRTAGDDGPSGSSLMTTGRYLQNSQNPAVGRQPGLLLAAVDYWSFHLGCFLLIFQGCISSFITQRYPVSNWGGLAKHLGSALGIETDAKSIYKNS